jgi:hypothetical protein
VIIAYLVVIAASEINALQQTFLSSLRAALLVCAATAAVGIFTALVRGNDGPQVGRARKTHHK